MSNRLIVLALDASGFAAAGKAAVCDASGGGVGARGEAAGSGEATRTSAWLRLFCCAQSLRLGAARSYPPSYQEFLITRAKASREAVATGV